MKQTININLSKVLQKKQKEFTKLVLETPSSVTKYWMLRASRQSGKTFAIERIAFALAMNKGEQSGAFIMATNAQCRKVFQSMVKWIPDCVIQAKNNSDGYRSITFCNNTVLYFYSSGSYDSVAGNSFDFIVGDEMGLWNRHAWSIIRPSLSAKKNAKVVLASTPRGKGENDFYKMCTEGTSEESTFVRHFKMSYLDNSYYDLREIEEAKKTMPAEMYRQEYLAEFIEGISDVFGEISKVQTLIKYPTINYNEKHYFGLDISGDGADKTILTIINSKGQVVLIYEVLSKSHPAQAKELTEVLKPFTDITGYGEKNGLGNSLCDLMPTSCNLVKWITTNDTKQELVAGLIESINDGEIELPCSDLCYKLDDQLSCYMAVRTRTGKINYCHPAGMHDDYVDSLMLADRARKELKSKSYTNKIQYNGHKRGSLYKNR